MPKKLLAGLLLLVLLPLAALGWLAQRTLHDEQAVLQLQVQALQRGQLQAVDEVLQSFLRRQAQSLQANLRALPLEAAALHRFARQSPQVRQVLHLGADGKLLFPAITTTDPQEQQFLERTAGIRSNPQILRSPMPGQTGDPASADHGWFSWHWNRQLHHLYWLRTPQNHLVGLELEPARLSADLIAELPDSGPGSLPQARIRLRDANGDVVYQWGRYEPAETALPQARLPLTPPLASWQLEFYGPAITPVGSRWPMLAGMLAVALALGGLAVFLYREQTRELRLAAQRVNFVNQVSHELKTPLTNIRLYAELLQDELADDDTAEPSPVQRYIGVITAESLRLSRLITNVLNFARLQKQRLPLQPQLIDLDELVRRSVEAFRPALQARGVVIRLECAVPQPVPLDAELVEQILNNLLSNVEKYGAAGGALLVTTLQDAAVVSVQVRDFGPGIPPAERERIFEPFYRLSNQLSDGVSGTGIGLGIARDLARLHGGELRVIDSDPGACFVLTLPVLSEPR